MSSQDELEATCETTPLHEDSQPASRSSRGLWGERWRFSPQTLIIPVVLATQLGILIPNTTFVELVRQTVCRLSNAPHDGPPSLVAGGSDPSDLCDAPEIVRAFSTAMAILGVMGGIISMAGYGILSRISSHYGRKPAFLFVLIAGVTGSCLIPWSWYIPGWLADWVFLAGILCQLFSGPAAYFYIVNMYIVDVCAPEDRTPALSKIAGWGALGSCISLALGGSITTKTGNPVIVFCIAAAMFASTFIYVVYVLPETFSEEKRNALSRMLLESSTHPTTTRLGFLHIFEPLKVLLPTRTAGGTRNWRLTWCAVHSFILVTVTVYVASAWMVLATSKYHLSPAVTGLFLSISAASSAIFLTVLVPPLVRVLRPYYRRRTTCSPLLDEGLGNSEEPELEVSDQLDVHLAIVSCIIAAISFSFAAASTTNLSLIVSGIFVGFSSIHLPTVHSLVAGSVDPLKQGEALAAIGMVNSAGGVFSPIIMGAILTATIDTAPLFLFHVHMVVATISAALLLLVRDADRYQAPNEM